MYQLCSFKLAVRGLRQRHGCMHVCLLTCGRGFDPSCEKITDISYEWTLSNKNKMNLFKKLKLSLFTFLHCLEQVNKITFLKMRVCGNQVGQVCSCSAGVRAPACLPENFKVVGLNPWMLVSCTSFFLFLTFQHKVECPLSGPFRNTCSTYATKSTKVNLWQNRFKLAQIGFKELAQNSSWELFKFEQVGFELVSQG